VRNEEVLQRVRQEKIVLQKLNRRKTTWSDHIFRRDFLLKQVIEGKIKGRIGMTGIRGRRRKQLLGNFKEKRVLEIERGSIRSQSMEKPLWKSLRTCRNSRVV
jgi:hypothetical protein